MNNLNVALLVRRFPNIVQPYIFNQIIAMENAGINIRVISGKTSTDTLPPTNPNNLHPYNKPVYINTSITNILNHIFSRQTFNTNYLHAILKVARAHNWPEDNIKSLFKKLVYARIIAFQNFDIIHSHSLFSTSNYLFLQDDFAIPIITTYHGVLPPGVETLSKKRLRYIFNKGAIFLANTESAKNDLANLGCPPQKIKIIPQGIYMGNFPHREHAIGNKQNIQILSVGRLSLEKGHSTAVEAFAELVKTYPAIKYHIIGDGPERDTLQKKIQELDLTDNIILHGFKTHDKLIPFYASADIFILPSLNETQGTVLQEAQSSGIPVIASKAGGIPEVVHDNMTGLLFKTNDHHELTNKIKTLITNPQLYKELSTAGRNDVIKRFDIHAVTQQLTDTYREVIQNQ